MSYWNEMGLLRNDNNKCFEKAYLLTRMQDRIKKIVFKYETIADDVVVDTDSSMPMAYDKRTKGIFVPSYWLPFVNGARVEFSDGTTMTISSITKVIDKDKAERDGKGIIGLNIYFGA